MSALVRGRALALARMDSTARVESVSVAPDPLTGADVETATVVLPASPCRVKAGWTQQDTAAGRAVTVVNDAIHFPWDTAGLTEGLRVTITASEQPLLVGLRYRLAAPHLGDQATAQRWGVESWR